MSVGSVVSAASTVSRNKNRFAPEYDVSNGFQIPKAFKRQKKCSRPHSTPGCAPDSTHRSERYRKAYVDAVATAQVPTAAFHHILGDGLLMLRHGHRLVYPSIFANLEKSHLRKTKTAPSQSRTQKGSFFSSQLERTPEESYRRRLPRGDIDDASSRRPTKTGKLVVEILTKSDNISKKSAGKVCRTRADYCSKNMELKDRCARSSDFPDIQINGRSLRKSLLPSGEYMTKEQCDVLGPLACHDCIRARAQNSHLRMCNIISASNATEVFKLALIHERIPQMGIREIQRKVYDGEISDSINPVSCWKEIKRCSQTKSVKNDEETLEKESVVCDSLVDYQENTRSKLKSSGSLKLVVFETIPESLEAMEGETEDDAKSELEQSDQRQVALSAGHPELTKSQTHSAKNDEIEGKDTSASVDELGESSLSTRPSNMHRKKSKKTSKRSLRVFTQDMIPSLDYFYDVSDLMERIKRYRRIRRKNFMVDVSPTEPSASREVHIPETAKLDQNNKDEASSVSSQDSACTRNDNSLKFFEPPILYGKRGRYLGSLEKIQ